MTQDGAGFGRDHDGHYAYPTTRHLIGTAVELIERPKRRNPPRRSPHSGHNRRRRKSSHVSKKWTNASLARG
jgi:hypothetical protein